MILKSIFSELEMTIQDSESKEEEGMAFVPGIYSLVAESFP